MFVEIIGLLKEYGFFEDKEQEEVYAFIKKLNMICQGYTSYKRIWVKCSK